MIPFYMCRDSDFMEQFCHLCFQVLLRRFRIYGIICVRRYTLFRMSGAFDPLKDCFIAKWFQDVVGCSFFEGIFRDPLLSNRSYNNKIRLFLYRFICAYHFHHTNSIHFRHDQVKKYNVRLFISYNVINIFSVPGFSHQFEIFITFYNFS